MARETRVAHHCTPSFGSVSAARVWTFATIGYGVTGMDGTFMQTVYAYDQHSAESNILGGEFEDIIRRRPGARYELDLTKFHELKTRRRLRFCSSGRARLAHAKPVGVGPINRCKSR